MSTHKQTYAQHSISFYLDLPQSTVRQPSNGHIKHLTGSRTTEEDSSRFVLAEWAQSAMAELWTVHREDEMSVGYSRENSSPWLAQSVCLHKFGFLSPLAVWSREMLRSNEQFSSLALFLTMVLATAHNFDNVWLELGENLPGFPSIGFHSWFRAKLGYSCEFCYT